MVSEELMVADFTKLMTDDYANYFLQKYFMVCGLEFRIGILQSLGPVNFGTIAQSPKGTYCLQKLL